MKKLNKPECLSREAYRKVWPHRAELDNAHQDLLGRAKIKGNGRFYTVDLYGIMSHRVQHNCFHLSPVGQSQNQGK